MGEGGKSWLAHKEREALDVVDSAAGQSDGDGTDPIARWGEAPYAQRTAGRGLSNG